jgi:hypothetical protein
MSLHLGFRSSCLGDEEISPATSCIVLTQSILLGVAVLAVLDVGNDRAFINIAIFVKGAFVADLLLCFIPS